MLILPASPYGRLPGSLAEVLGSRPLTLAADGMLYRESLAQAAFELGLDVRRYPRKTDPALLAAEAMGVQVADVHALIARFGREAGPPVAKGPQAGGGCRPQRPRKPNSSLSPPRTAAVRGPLRTTFPRNDAKSASRGNFSARFASMSSRDRVPEGRTE